MTNVIKRQCDAPGCSKLPTFAMSGSRPIRCAEHRGQDMIRIRPQYRRLCDAEGCKTRPSYGIPGGRADRCAEHRKPGMVDVVSCRCTASGCGRLCTFGVAGGRASRCREHKDDGMVNVRCTRCDSMGCENISPRYGLPGNPGTRCAKHREPEMIDVYARRCSAPGCKSTKPSYRISGQQNAYCRKHKPPGAVSTRPICEYTGCTLTPTHGLPGAKVVRCIAHRLDRMIMRPCLCCIVDGCTVRPSFAFEGEKSRYCKAHKLPGMINVIGTDCSSSGCRTRPCFGYPGGRVECCKLHSTSEMVNLIAAHCVAEGCLSRPTYGVPGFAAILCAKHKEHAMVAYDGTSLSIIRNPSARCHCKEPATHGVTSPDRCENHRLPGDLNMVESPCVKCGIVFRLDPSTSQCIHCYTHSVHTPRLAKQREVRQFIDQTDLASYSSYDRVPLDLSTCGDKERPDFLWLDWGGVERAWALGLECDEHQHQNRTAVCEHARMVNIGQSLGRFMLWIRYNPDRYKPAHEKQQQVPKAERLAELVRHLRAVLTELPVHPSAYGAVLRLFFDGYDSTAPAIEWHELGPEPCV